MHKIVMESALCCALCVAGTAFGQSTAPSGANTPTDTSVDNSSTTSPSATESTTFIKLKDLVGAHVKDSQGNKVGEISELWLNHTKGEIFASIGVSGGRYALVPVQALQVTRPAGLIRDATVTVNKTKAELESGPTVAKHEWNRLDTPSFVQSIYAHYNVQHPSAMGASDTSSLGGTSTGSSLRHPDTNNVDNLNTK